MDGWFNGGAGGGGKNVGRCGAEVHCDWRGVTFYKTVMEVNMAQVVKRKEWTRKELKKNKKVRRVFDDRCLTV
jgi:hypothetical protein